MMKRLFILLLTLCSLQAFSQPVTGSFGASGTTTLFKGSAKVSEFFFLPGIVSGTPSWAGAARYNPSDSSMYLWTGYQWVKSSGASIDSFTYATRRYVDSSVSASVPTLQQVLTAGNTATLHLTTTGNITGADITGTGSGYFGGGKVVLWDGGTVGIGDFYDPSDNVHTSINYNYGGNVSTNRIELVGSMSAPVAPMTNTGFFYHRSGTPYFYYNGTETAIGSGGGGASTTLSTLTYGATTTWDYSTQGTAAKVTLTGNTTLSITNLPASVTYLTLEVVQDATGSRTITLPAGTKVIGGGAGAVTLTTTGGATDILTFYYNGTTLYCNIGTNYN